MRQEKKSPAGWLNLAGSEIRIPANIAKGKNARRDASHDGHADYRPQDGIDVPELCHCERVRYYDGTKTKDKLIYVKAIDSMVRKAGIEPALPFLGSGF